MKRLSVIVLLCIALCACSQFGCLTPDDGFTRTRKKVASGITYEHLKRAKAPEQEPLNIHVLSVDPSKASMKLVLAQDKVLGKETTTSMAARENAVAAINGGFYIMKGDYQGDLDGFFVQDGIILSDPAEKRSSFGFCTSPKGQETIFEQFELTSTISPENGEPIQIDGINRKPEKGETILLTEKFGGSATITPEMSVIVGNGASGNTVKYDLTSLRSGLNHPIEKCSFTSAGPTLILNGEVIQDYSSESPKFTGDFVDKRHPRTAVGQKEDGTLLFVVVDGRQPLLSVGMTLPELAEFMKKRGAVNAYNLDGGGSSTMVVRNAIVNSPSDKAGERPLSDAIVIKSR
jgi:exopolysaccharide biosynthesis protein